MGDNITYNITLADDFQLFDAAKPYKDLPIYDIKRLTPLRLDRVDWSSECNFVDIRGVGSTPVSKGSDAPVVMGITGIINCASRLDVLGGWLPGGKWGNFPGTNLSIVLGPPTDNAQRLVFGKGIEHLQDLEHFANEKLYKGEENSYKSIFRQMGTSGLGPRCLHGRHKVFSKVTDKEAVQQQAMLRNPSLSQMLKWNPNLSDPGDEITITDLPIREDQANYLCDIIPTHDAEILQVDGVVSFTSDVVEVMVHNSSPKRSADDESPIFGIRPKFKRPAA